MFKATEIALWFIYRSNAEQKEHYDSEELFEGISDLKLQKLLYYAQGVCLSMTGKKMFSNKNSYLCNAKLHTVGKYRQNKS